MTQPSKHPMLGIPSYGLSSVLFFFLFFGLTTSAAATEFRAKVIHITDGDTITVLNEAKEKIKIRLNGIDCPESGQAFGKKATQFTKRLVAGEIVTIQPYDKDKYRRTIADVILEDGRNLSQELVKAGYAWWYFKYSDDEQLGILEVKAKIAKVGLWGEKNPLPPWIYRHQSSLPTPPLTPGHPAPLGFGETPELKPSPPILGNRRSQKYHRPDCPNYPGIAPHNQVPFQLARRGCCSHHNGVCGCQRGRQECCDGSLSPTCRCFSPGPLPKEYAEPK